MKTFQYIKTEPISSVDLSTLGKTFSTLEQGHKEAVETASNLELEIAKMDMNEEEDGFKQELVNEIKNTIDNNTIYGNSYAALDDLILKYGNIATDGRVVGRLRNQAAKKEYDAKVDKMDIPDGMKEMYKSENPYYYKEGEVDSRTGRILPGEKWSAKSNPVTTVSETEIGRYALQIAAKESGSGDVVSFLDENGKEVFDPSKSVDGAFYKKVGTSWERLPANKIAKAYKIAIDSIPGAKDSLHQDYKYTIWQYNKELDNYRKQGRIDNPIVPGLTDENGNIYSEKKWLNNKIGNFADVAKINNVHRTVNYGTALENKRKREAEEAKRKREAGKEETIENNKTLDFLTANDLGIIEVKKDAYSSAIKAKNNASNTGLNIMNNIASDFVKGKSFENVLNSIISSGNAKDTKDATKWFIDNYGKNMTSQEKINLVNAAFVYSKTNEQINDMIKKAGANVDALKFSSNINNQIYTNDNKYGQRIIRELNELTADGKKIVNVVGKNVYNNLLKIYGVKDLKDVDIDYTINSDGNYIIKFDSNNSNNFPTFDDYLDSASSAAKGNIWQSIKQQFGFISPSYYNRYIENEDGSHVRGGVLTGPNNKQKYATHLKRLRTFYKQGKEAAEKIQEKVGGYYGYKNVLGTGVSTPGEIYWMDIGKKEGMTDEQIRAKRKECSTMVDNAIATGNLAGGKIFLIGDPDDIKSIRKFEHQVGNATELNLLLQHMYSEYPNNVTRICSAGDDIVPAGYSFSFTVPHNDESAIGKKYKGKTINMYVTGSIDDGSNYKIDNNPKYIAKNFIGTSKATGSQIENIGYDDNLGDTRIIPIKEGENKGKYSTNILGRTTVLNEQRAEFVTEQIIRLEEMKLQLGNIVNNPNITREQKADIIDEYIEEYSNNLGDALEIHPEIVSMAIINYLNNK